MDSAKTYLFTGLSGSGKSTLVKNICIALGNSADSPYLPFMWLDGDILRGREGERTTGLCGDLKFSPEDRRENLRRVAETARLFNHYREFYSERGIDVLASYICPLEEYREMMKEIIGPENFKLIFVKAPLKVCEKRDPKGLYKLAKEGKIKDFTGIDAPFEEPKNPDLILNTEKSIDKCVALFEKFYNSITEKTT